MAFPSNLNTASSYRSLFKSLSLLLLLLALVACSITAVAAAGDVVSDDFDDLDMDIDNGQGFAHIEDSTDSPEDLAYENKKFYHDVLSGAAGWARANFWWIMPLMLSLLLLNFLFLSHSVGYVLNKEHVVVRAVKFNKPVDAVWKLLTVQEQYPIWRKSVYAATFVERPDMENKVIVEKTLFGETHYEVTETKRNQIWVRMVRPLPQTDHSWLTGGYWFAGKCTFEFGPPSKGEKGCTLYVTKQGIVTVPIIRFLWSTYGFDSDVVRLLKDLGSALGQKKVDIVRPVNGKLPF
ncbi:hypothetical protein BASA50_001530 [Batrachochytrium salamandrivorans]|uniref:Coenzyme Q-binding protein COQ10 START domain-containing protein n=1 Tax=Batrachochytrium salamandrivorans TaxID=1357716 RepID=A0ABQ8FNY7_9FUNG|nr:hypothetical protein BASA62_007088 [Batrachochytrium salamandrivorans]KAH6574062.1 hypothetical protein BASA60_005720 [Batrachochytrium salamandrivorans]KAH6579731.1 hypothetical protein BASA61_010074 [Batrachochytrium salamandrivorans]KAH6601583.1 hypothetical protein BASA50_001530 [Batrachochytrium salamandrivorans]KAH9247499.1 hypothetical protein BASA81_014884 [Batrachochytrium salamandrivorans]